ncbi:MAG: DNA-processing protein DprA, partial [Chlamydiota bacterium]|nr:DNA-processing protein DprA [Chlamydiota bacterium]
ARGIDTQSHLGALQANGSTYAVLGSGLDELYPAENNKWVRKMMNEGGLISEFSCTTKPLAGHFPRRNRIISGLSLGIVVVEASRKSGSLITADFALEQGREVFAVPGSVHSPNTKGVHHLIKQGARLVESVEDIVEELGLAVCTYDDGNSATLQVTLTENEKKILSSLNTEPVAIDQICQRTSISSQIVVSLLFGLEMKKMVKQYPGKYYLNIVRKTNNVCFYPETN